MTAIITGYGEYYEQDKINHLNTIMNSFLTIHGDEFNSIDNRGSIHSDLLYSVDKKMSGSALNSIGSELKNSYTKEDYPHFTNP